MNTAPASPTTNRRRRRWLAVLASVAAVLLAALLLGPILASRIAAGILGAKLGGEVSIGSIEPRAWGRVWLVRDLRVRVRDWPGPAGEIAAIERLELRIDRARLLRGEWAVQQADAEGVLLRIAEDAADPSRLSILGLTPPPRSDAAWSPPGPLQVAVDGLRIEAGEVRDGRWQRRGTRWFRGWLTPVDAPDGPGAAFEFLLNEIAPAGEGGPGSGLLLKGLVDASAGGASVQIAGVRLDESLIDMTPLLVRQWLERFEIAGRIEQATVEWQREDAEDAVPQWKASLTIADASLRLEDLGENLWARYADGRIEALEQAPRMHLDGGKIVMGSESIRLEELVGRFGSIADGEAGVPFWLDFEMDLASVPVTAAGEISPWARQRERFARGVALAPFALKLEIDDFRSVSTEEGGTTPIDLPIAAGRALEQLAATAWSMDLDVDLRRGLPAIGPDGGLVAATVRSEGVLALKEGRGSYFRFPYPLENAEANIRFRDELIDIDYIRGRGAGDSDIQIGGQIEYGDDDDVAISLRIASQNAVADEVLLRALDAGPRELLETLFDAAAAERLAKEGLLLDAAAIAALEASLPRAGARLDGSGDPLDPEARERLERERERIAAVAAGGPFVLGGRLGLTIDLKQGFGRDAPLRTTGTITLQRAGVLLRGFPYPLVVTGGRIVLHDERIELEEPRGLEFVTPAGGFGRIRGAIAVPRLPSSDGEDLRGFAPDLRITVADDQVNPALLAAIPFPHSVLGEAAEGDGPSAWNRLIRAAGQVDLHGTVQPGDAPDGDPRWSFTALASGLAADASESLREILADNGLDWPEDARLEEGQAVIEIDPDRVGLRSMQATFDGVPAELAGEWRDATSEFEVQATFTGLSAPRWLRAAAMRLDLAPLAVGGTFDCEATWRGNAAGIDASFRLQGGQVDLAVPGPEGSALLGLSLDAGAIAANRSFLTFEDAAIGIRGEDGGVGVIHLDGELALGDPEPDAERAASRRGHALQGRWDGGRAESAAVRLLVDRLLPSRAASLLEEAAPEGRFELAFRRTSGGGEPTRGELGFSCEDLRFQLDGERVSAATESPLRLEFSDDRLRLLPSTLALARLPDRESDLPAEAAARVGVSLEMDLGEATRLDLAADLALPAFPFPGVGRLPEAVRNTVAAIGLRSGETRVAPLALEVRWPGDATETVPEAFALDTTIAVRDASFDAGVPFREVAGEARLRFGQDAGDAVSGDAAIAFDQALVRDRRLEEATALLRYEGDRDRILVSPLAARVYGGFLDGKVLVLLDEDRYELDLLFDEIASARFLAGEPPRGDEDGEGKGDGTPLAADADAEDDGRVRGRFRLGGSLADSVDRVGRGSFSIVAGRLGNLPVGLRLLQLAQLSLPIHESMADAEVRFHISGHRLVFERLEFFCDTLSLEGEGHLDLEAMEIDARFASRGTTPLVSDLVAPITGSLFAVELVGPVTDPEAIVRPLPGLVPRLAGPPRRDRESDRVHIEP